MPPVKGMEALKIISHNLSTTLTQDSASLKVGAAFTSTLVHVLLRCGVAVGSARTAPPQDQFFVKRQSAEVLFRELVGFTLGYGVVKKFDKVLKKRLEKALQFEKETPQTVGLFKSLGLAKDAIFGKELNLERAPMALTGETITHSYGGPKPNLEKLGRFLRDQLPNAFDDLHGLTEKSVTAEALEKGAFKFLHTVVPLAIGSVPAIFISGWALERLTLLHGEEVVDFITNTSHHDKPHFVKLKKQHLASQGEPIPENLTQQWQGPAAAQPLNNQRIGLPRQAINTVQPFMRVVQQPAVIPLTSLR